MALVDTVRARYPVDLSMFEASNRKTTLDRHTTKPTIHLAIPSLQQYNLTRTILGHPEDVLRIIFENAVEGDAIHTTFSSFSQPRPNLAPLSVRGTSRQCAQYADSEPSLWTSVSGVQHSPNSPHPELIKLWIKRAGPTRPLSFHIAPRDHHAPWEDEMTPAILRIFLQHALRWKNIAFDLDDALAPIYLEHLSNRLKAKPHQVENLELVASRVTDTEVTRRLFGTIELYADTLSNFLWGCPKGFTPSTQFVLPQVKVFGLDVDSLDDACRCLENLDLPMLEELKICFSDRRGFYFWSDVRQPFTVGLRKLPRVPTRLFIQDDEINPEDVLTLIRVAKGSGIMALTLLASNPEMILAECRGCLEKRFWDLHLPHIKSCVMNDDDGSVEILL